MIVALYVIALSVIVAVAARFAWIARNRRRYAIVVLDDFLSEAECQHLIDRARPNMKESGVIFGGQRGGDPLDRDSATAFLDQAGDRIIQGIKRRIAELVEMPVENQERIQVTHYTENQRYDLHFDALRAAHFDPGEAGDRVCTVIVYLNDDFEGGATYFPRVRRRVLPRRGRAVYFRNLSEDCTRLEPLSIHAGERVRGGEKWLSNQWIRQNRRHAPGPTAKVGRRSGARRRKRTRR